MTSLCRHLSAQEIVNWVTTADGCVHTADADATKQLNSFVPSASAVCIGHYARRNMCNVAQSPAVHGTRGCVMSLVDVIDRLLTDRVHSHFDHLQSPLTDFTPTPT